MARIVICVLISFACLTSCNELPSHEEYHAENWSKRRMDVNPKDSLETGKTYLSIYSQIYSMSQHKTHNLTAMASMRNTSDTDTIFVTSAKYYDAQGKLIRTYFDKSIYLAPMETTEVIIEELDIEGGTGSNFIFEWKKAENTSEPLFEGIMNSTLGQQGLSFSTTGKRIK
ncbi:DUF3124 domain-containing protein [Bizionia myxarmorum]|uniref:DUF3124 domain-containing protein n=1 Tax=Bizionia myxarmorum TaxID=291186 RepID=A0A5D0R6X8_9FLAO|nr:DUF3124 domain-containing protein [Bizionia myxarmorum]TYB76428.1 DUF3124 domain-containing protein [Bizionia myxarmorum]